MITQVLQGQSPLDQSTNRIALQFCNLTSYILKKKQEVFKTLQSRICVVSSHAKEGKLLELFFEGDGNLPSQMNNFWKLSNGMVMTRGPPVCIFPSSVFGGSTQECTAILPALM